MIDGKVHHEIIPKSKVKIYAFDSKNLEVIAEGLYDLKMASEAQRYINEFDNFIPSGSIVVFGIVDGDA